MIEKRSLSLYSSFYTFSSLLTLTIRTQSLPEEERDQKRAIEYGWVICLYPVGHFISP